MKNKTQHVYYLFYPRSWIIIALLLFSATTTAQETPPSQDKFYVGTEFQNQTVEDTRFYDPFYTSGMNFITQRADISSTWSYIHNYDMLAVNVRAKEEYISHYTTCYYSKWEAEVDAEADRVGFKHRDSLGYLIGKETTWNGKTCWSSQGLSGPRDSLMYGPHYRQDKRYKRILYDSNHKDSVYYIPRFIMALDNHGNAAPNEDVCRIKVVYRYRLPNSNPQDAPPFIERTLKVADFDTARNFSYLYLHPDPQSASYIYPDQFWLPKNIDNFPDVPSSVEYIDNESYTGIQYCVDWLGNDELFTLYIDYAEVYDKDGWSEYVETPGLVTTRIQNYIASFDTTVWQNIKFWAGVDEPYSIDCYEPIRVVDSIIRIVNPDAPLVVTFNPTWHWSNKINGEDEVTMFYNIAMPKKITLSVNPCAEWWPLIRFDDFEWLRFNLQRTSALDPNFWFNAQTHGYWKNYPNEPKEWCTWRKPEPEELRSMVMLALAHGTKGIIFKWFDSYTTTMFNDFCNTSNALMDCIVTPLAQPTALYNEIKNNLAPRLTGKLGKTLMKLDYTGDFLQLRYSTPTQPQAISYEYLTLGLGQPADYMNWHCGFFIDSTALDDNYFHLTNLITTEGKNIYVKIQTPDRDPQDPLNYRFRNVEGLFDTTIQAPNYLVKLLTYPPGEGYLYEFAPVIKYGGRLFYPESTQPGMILGDDMIIENGAVLTVNGVYSSKGNIVIKNGGILNGSEGKIQFVEGKKLIIEGSGSISGTANNILEIVFAETQQDITTGIQIKSAGSLTISNCKVEDATIGIESLLNANYLNAQNVDFIDCVDYSINIAGRSPGMNPTPQPQISYCTMENSNYGISVSNMSSILIQGNYITNTACGIYLSNVTDVQIIGNQINSNREELEGIMSLSSGGIIRANTITGHTSGLHIANSSPKLGDNTITSNKYHGIYIGTGSNPYMRGEYIGNPPNMYALSGYNEIKENGGYQEIGGPRYNDGSEIYFQQSTAVLDRGCNSIVDDRQASPPLINTLLLMNGLRFGFPTLQAQNNFWGDTVYTARFGSLSVSYIPYETVPCPEPQGGGGEEELVMMTQFGEVIDTVYSTGIEVPALTQTEINYAEAEEYFLTGNLTSALQIYEAIINSSTTEEEKYFAYERKYSIGKLTCQSTEFFNELSNTFSTLATNTQDTLNNKILNQFSTLSKVGEQEYETAIDEFDGIIQQNPNTEEAIYAEIDALTTALLIEEADSTLHKGRLGKYLIKSSADYNQKVDEILRKNFGGSSKENARELLPTEYILYQNYPNPFNPTTTIKYDLPDASEVSLIIYDILGRKVKELVNTKQPAGKYEVQFDASSLSSGVYIYQLIADKFISSKKMILLK